VEISRVCAYETRHKSRWKIYWMASTVAFLFLRRCEKFQYKYISTLTDTHKY